MLDWEISLRWKSNYNAHPDDNNGPHPITCGGVGWGVGGWWGYFKQVTSLGLGIKHSSKSWVSPDWPVTSHGQSGKCKWMFESHRNVECRAWRLLFVFPSACEGPDSLTFSQVANSRTMAITLEPNYMQLSDWTLPAPWECCYQLMGNKQMRASGELWAAKSPSKPGVELQWSVGDWDLSSVQISKLLTPDRHDDHQEQPGLKVGLASTVLVVKYLRLGHFNKNSIGQTQL